MAHACIEPDPDRCFTCKLRYWREAGGLSVSYQGGRDFFHDTTIGAEQRRIVAEGRANGADPVPKTNVYTGR